MPDLSLVNWSWLHLLIPLAIFQRITELPRSKKNERRLRALGAVEHGRDHYPAIVAMHTLWFIVMILELIIIPRQISPWWYLLLPTLLGVEFLRYWTLRTLGDRWTTRILVLPDEEPVTEGPYRWFRHPNYIVVIAEILLVPLILGCYVTAVTFSIANGIMLSIRIRAERGAWYQTGGEKPASTLR